VDFLSFPLPFGDLVVSQPLRFRPFKSPSDGCLISLALLFFFCCLLFERCPGPFVCVYHPPPPVAFVLLTTLFYFLYGTFVTYPFPFHFCSLHPVLFFLNDWSARLLGFFQAWSRPSFLWVLVPTAGLSPFTFKLMNSLYFFPPPPL